MIVRISTEGQYELAEADIAELNQFDNAAVQACEASDEPGFRAAFGQLLALVREKGRRLDGDSLVGSDLILPPPDVSLEEAQGEFHGEGLIPG